ncbi:MAG: alkaline phosphatase D family protein, partial [Myxococcales bacterium]|nr:alkaline phosphatase D family protein [Myxococcales bacterium]
DSALIWSRCDRQATMVVEWSAGSARGRVYGPSVGPASDFAGTTMLRDLPAGAAVEYRVRFLAEDGRTRSAPVEGLLRTAPVGGQPLRILWSGDTCGQGYGIDAARGGLQTYAAMLARAPDLFVHCGDLIYADNPIPATIKLADGTEWRNQTMAGREKVAETIDEFRAAYRYNLLDEHYARFHRTVATIFAWDDHEVLNNWYPGEILGDDEPRYQVREVDVLAARGRQRGQGRALADRPPARLEGRLLGRAEPLAGAPAADPLAAGVERERVADLGEREAGLDLAEVEPAAAAAAGVFEDVGAVRQPRRHPEGDPAELGRGLVVDRRDHLRGARLPEPHPPELAGDARHQELAHPEEAGARQEHQLLPAGEGVHEVTGRVAEGLEAGRHRRPPWLHLEERELEVALADLRLEPADQIEEGVEIVRQREAAGLRVREPAGRHRGLAEVLDDV